MFGLFLVLALTVPASGSPEAAPGSGFSAAPRRDDFHLAHSTTVASLSWDGVRYGSESVLLDGRPLRAVLDYTLHPEAGTVVLRRPAPAGSLLQVTYHVRPHLARPGAPEPGRVSAPDPGPAAQPGAAARHGGLRTALAADLAGSRGGPMPRSLLRLSLAGEPARGLQVNGLREELLSGLRHTVYGEDLVREGGRTASVSYVRADPLDPRVAGSGREEFSTRLDLRPSPTSRLLFNNYLSRESPFTENYLEQERQRFQYERALGRSTATLLWDRRRTEGGHLENFRDSVSLALAHPFSRSTIAEGVFLHENSLYRGHEFRSLFTLRQHLGSRLEAQASLQHRLAEFAGDSLDTGLTLYGRPGASGDVTVSYRRSDSERYGRNQRVKAEAGASLSNRLHLSAEVARRTSDRSGDLLTYGLGLAARPTARALLEAGLSERQGDVAGRERLRTLRLAMDPAAALKLQLGYDMLESTRDGSARTGIWIVTLGERRYLKVDGYSALYDLGGGEAYEDSLYRVEIRPLSPLALSASLRRVESDLATRELLGVAATLELFRGVEITGGYRRPQELDPGLPVPVGKDVRLTVAPLAGLRLFGQYSHRPDDTRGALLEQLHRTVGLETRLGSFSLLGSVTSAEGLQAEGAEERVDLLASLDLGGATRLYGGLRTYDGGPGERSRQRIYRLGISQSVGQMLFLMLEGQLGWTIDDAGARARSAEDTRAQARIGIRF